jgi:hypothetical protein
VEQAEKDRMEKLAIDSAINEALAVNGARSPKVLAPHVRAACRVSWVSGLPIVTATKNGTDEISVTSFVSEMKHDVDFALNFHRPPDPSRRDEDGLRRISSTDQASLNKYCAEIAAGTCEVLYPAETTKKLGEFEVDRRDQGALNASLEDIAAGKVTVVG